MKIPKISLKDNSKALIWVGGSLLVCLLLIIFLIIPQILLAFKEKALVAQTEQKAATLKEKSTALKQVDKNTYQDDLSTSLTILPTSKDLPAMVDEVQVLLQKHHLQLTDLSFPNIVTPTSNDLQSFQIKLEVNGDVNSLKDFINDLNNAPILLKLDGLEITASRGGLTQNDLTLLSYYQAAPTSLGSVDQPLDLITQSDEKLLAKLKQNVQTTPVITSTTSIGSRGKSDPFQ